MDNLILTFDLFAKTDGWSHVFIDSPVFVSNTFFFDWLPVFVALYQLSLFVDPALLQGAPSYLHYSLSWQLIFCVPVTLYLSIIICSLHHIFSISKLLTSEMMNCPMVSFWATCPFPLQKTPERISMRIPHFVLFHVVSWAPLLLDNAAHQACVTIVHKNIWKHRNISPSIWNLDSSKFFSQIDTS